MSGGYARFRKPSAAHVLRSLSPGSGAQKNSSQSLGTTERTEGQRPGRMVTKSQDARGLSPGSAAQRGD